MFIEFIKNISLYTTAYTSIPIKEKESIVKTLCNSSDELSRTKEGRNSIRVLGLDMYQRSPEEWRKNLGRQDRFAI